MQPRSLPPPPASILPTPLATCSTGTPLVRLGSPTAATLGGVCAVFPPPAFFFARGDFSSCSVSCFDVGPGDTADSRSGRRLESACDVLGRWAPAALLGVRDHGLVFPAHSTRRCVPSCRRDDSVAGSSGGRESCVRRGRDCLSSDDSLAGLRRGAYKEATRPSLRGFPQRFLQGPR